MFLTKTGDLGVILEVRGVDYECLDENTLDGLTKRLESALKLFDDNYRIYQYLFKRNNETIPYKLYGNPVVDTAIKNRIRFFAAKSDTVFSLSICYVILFEGFRYTRTLGSTRSRFRNGPPKRSVNFGRTFQVGNRFSSSTARLPRAKPALFRRSKASFSRSAIFCLPFARQTRSLQRSQEDSRTLPRRRSNLPGSSTTPFSITTSANPISNATEDTSALTTIT